MQAVNALIQVAGIPILLRFWGVEYYGEWLLLFTIPSYVGMSDMGLGTATTSELSMLVQGGKAAQASVILRNTFWFILLVGGIPFLLLGLSMFVLPWYEWLHFSKITDNEFGPAFFFLLLYVYLALFLTLPLGYYRVQQVYHRERVISSIFRIIEFASVVVAVIMGCKIVIVAVVYFAVRLIMLIYVLLELSRRYEGFRLLPFSLEYSKIRHLLRPGLSAMTIYMGQNFMLQGLVSIIGIGLGSAQVVVFSTARTLVNVVKQVVGIVNLSVTSEFSYAYGAGTFNLLRRLFKLASWSSLILATVLLLILYFSGSWIMSIWTDNKITLSQPFFGLILISTLVNAVWNIYLVLLVSTNKLGRTGVLFLCSALCLLVINAIGIKHFGLSGLAATIIGFEFSMMIIMWSACHKVLHVNREVSVMSA